MEIAELRSCKLIVGSGLTAGLAANLLCDVHELSLSFLPFAKFSSMPEILPRRAFFDALELSRAEEAAVISKVSTSAREVVWNDGNVSAQRSLESTDDFFIYDKGLLASWLLDRAIQRGVHAIKSHAQSSTIQEECKNFDAVLDCRGAGAVAKDPGYTIRQETLSSTYCTYAIIKRPKSMSNDHLVFWSVLNEYGLQRTFFAMPCGTELTSVGGSYCEGDQLDITALLDMMCSLGYPLTPSDVKLTANVAPHRFSCSHSHPKIIPLGDAARSTCPLTEYGVMSALSQLLQLRGDNGLLPSVIRRPASSQIDPHIPVELFL
ncbi:hypothetical protein HBO04_07755 [Pseudomonas proteolytica]|uniref:hypothetical protein n=1 Tax=Pseudomonas proteolytica TaxID=219574 RepID=UPI001473EDF4|nr:hypothetical protein [Pseudomonas proteolytica]NMZ00009.1 hypothetical protein [Pseudomonas proteolytica]